MTTRDPAVTSKIMKAVKHRDTGPELQLRRALHRRGLRYRVHTPMLGRPDIVFSRAKVAVFVDGDYWHGNTWRLRGASSFEAYYTAHANGEFWRLKIAQNMARDQLVTQRLTDDGWRVLRLWESQVETDLERCVSRIVEATRPPVAGISA